MNRSTSTALPSLTASWAQSPMVLPPLGNLDAYIAAVHRMPMLTAEEEDSLAGEVHPSSVAKARGPPAG